VTRTTRTRAADAANRATGRMLRHALALAEAGWAVLPLNGKQPATIPGLIEHGHKDATIDPAVIRRIWGENPEYNIGCPVPRSLLVIDVDPHNGGSLEELEHRAGAKLPRTLEVISGRGDGGRHLYFKRPFERPYRGDIPLGIDIKINGYMVMPPSIHPASGKPYRWVDREVARLPRGVKALMLPRSPKRLAGKPGASSPVALVSWFRTLQAGERHDGLFWAASRAHEAGMSQRGLEKLIEAAVDNGFSQQEATRVVESARKKERA